MAGEFSAEYGNNSLTYRGASGAYLSVNDGSNTVQLFSYGLFKNGQPLTSGATGGYRTSWS